MGSSKRKRSTFQGRRGDNAWYLALSASRGAIEAENRSQRLLMRLMGAAASRA